MNAMNEKLMNTCPFRATLCDRGDSQYSRREVCYIRAYLDGVQWWNTVYPINWEMRTPELMEEADAVYCEFQKAFPTVSAIQSYIDHHAEKSSDSTEGNAYLEREHGLYWFRMIARKGDYNLYLHVLSKAVVEK